MRRLQAVLCVFGLAAVFMASAPISDAHAAEASAGPTLPPAEYKPLPVGTRVDYDTWSYTVTKSNGFDITYKDGNKRAHQYAVFGKAGKGLYGDDQWTAILESKTKQAWEGFWPLEVGKKIRLQAKEENPDFGEYSGYTADHAFTYDIEWEIAIEVTGTEALDLNGVLYATYVVREQATTGESGIAQFAYSAKHWYHPGSGLVLKSIKKWIEGPLQGEEEEYQVTRVRYPKGTTNLALKGNSDPPLPPAEYKPLPVGTQVVYDNWSYRVTKSDGFDVTYKADNNWFHHYGAFGKSGEAVYGTETNQNGEGWDATLGDEARSALEKLWPLEPGKKARFKVSEEKSGYSASIDVRDWEVAIEVVGTVLLTLNLTRYATYLINEHAVNEGSISHSGSTQPTGYTAAHWYHPGSGLVLKSSKKWIEGPSQGEEEEYQLTRVRYPKGTTNLALKGTSIGAGGATEADLAAAAEQAKRQAEQKYQAEIARLKKAAEANRKSAPQTSETAEQYKSEIERLRREAEARQKAELARLKRDAEIARLRRETEASRRREVAATEKRGDKRVENALWTVARGSRSIDDTRAYLDLYPKGRYAGEAETRLSVLEKFAAVEGINFGTYHALIIGNDDYRNLPDLKTAVNDAKAIAKLLSKDYGFKVKTLINATHADIIDTLDEYRETLTDLDNLLIYYAGHGWLDEDTSRGYWLPVDAKKNRRSRWVSNATITDTLQGLLAKHVMVVADSCYSGTLVRGAGVSLRTAKYWQRMAQKRTRVALTSGGLEPVADKGGGGHSPFAEAFIDTLKNNQVVMDGTQLFSRMRRPIMVNADQTPEYSDVRNAGHDGGDFLFVKKF